MKLIMITDPSKINSFFFFFFFLRKTRRKPQTKASGQPLETGNGKETFSPEALLTLDFRFLTSEL